MCYKLQPLQQMPARCNRRKLFARKDNQLNIKEIASCYMRRKFDTPADRSCYRRQSIDTPRRYPVAPRDRKMIHQEARELLQETAK